MSAGDRIGVVDYEVGNLRSVMNALEAIDCDARLVDTAAQVGDCARLLLPGVGAFEAAIRCLRGSGMVPALERHVAAGKPLLGICVGMQLMCTRSFENGEHEGLGWIDAEVRAFPADIGISVPHMGWNGLDFVREHPLATGVENDSDVYFLHSYMISCKQSSDLLAQTRHGVDFASMFAHDNLFGMQFHPEKSQSIGLKLLNNFARLEC